MAVMVKHVIATAIATALAASASVGAQRATPPPHPFANVPAFKCAFKTFSVTGWGDPAPSAVTAAEDFTFSIVVVNLKKGRARIVGSNATVEASLVLTPTGLNVIEQTPIGNMLMTTVFTSGSAGGRYLAVHARHVGDLTAMPSPSQHYGSCEIVK